MKRIILCALIGIFLNLGFAAYNFYQGLKGAVAITQGKEASEVSKEEVLSTMKGGLNIMDQLYDPSTVEQGLKNLAKLRKPDNEENNANSPTVKRFVFDEKEQK